jgi:hypothetical protein
MKHVLVTTGAALLIGFASVTSAMSAGKGDSGGRGSSGGNGGGSAMAHSGGGNGGGSAMAHSSGGGGAISRSGGGGTGVSTPRAASGSTFTGGNNMSGQGNMRTGRMDGDRGGRPRGSNFAFGFYPGYDSGYNDYSYSDYGYDPGCYQMRRLHTRSGWRWQQVWVCN